MDAQGWMSEGHGSETLSSRSYADGLEICVKELCCVLYFWVSRKKDSAEVVEQDAGYGELTATNQPGVDRVSA